MLSTICINKTSNSIFHLSKKRIIIKTLFGYFHLQKKHHFNTKVNYLCLFNRKTKHFCYFNNFYLFNSFQKHVSIFLNNTQYAKFIKTLITHNQFATVKSSYYRIGGVVLNNTKPLFFFIYLYAYLLFFTRLELFYLFKRARLLHPQSFFTLTLTFNTNKLFLNISNIQKKNYIAVSAGLFLKFFEKKKALKRGKNLKFVAIRYIRKLLLILKIQNLSLTIRKKPLYLLQLLNLLNKPIIHKFYNPLKKQVITENEMSPLWLKIPTLLFFQNKSFIISKNAKMGRIKRKIRRKLIILNKLID